jgi:hypothetical protein
MGVEVVATITGDGRVTHPPPALVNVVQCSG